MNRDRSTSVGTVTGSRGSASVGWLVVCVLAFALGVVLGRSLVPSPTAPTEPAAENGAQVWTCSMHPQLREESPGTCPICGMDLTLAESETAEGGELVLSENAQRVASIEVEVVARRLLEREVRTVGRIELSEPSIAHLTARAAGRVERLYADYTGVEVKAGDHLVDLYSPDLVVAQEEFLLGLRALDAGGASRHELAREKLRLLGITEEQIAELERTRRPSLILTVHAPIGGTVIEKSVREGMYVETGEALYSIADFSHVWLLADVYEFELPWIARGQKASLRLVALPGESFEGTVAFIDPRVDQASRTVKLRINLANPERRLKPGMFAHVSIHAALSAGGMRAASSLAGKYACPMHPEIASDEQSDCPLCGMALTLEAEAGEGGAAGELLAVPVSAVLDSGRRRIVWVEREPGRFEAAEVVLGPRAVDAYPVLEGLAEGDRVVVRGNFLLDSQAQIEGKPSLLFPDGLARAGASEAAHTGH